MDGVAAGLASIPEREEALQRTLTSIVPQVDEVFLSLNDYTEFPEWLDDFPTVTATLRPENSGDAEKFAAVDEWDSYFIAIDDDLIYPADYVETLLKGLARYGEDKIVGFHGGKTHGFNGKAYAATHKVIRCLDELAEDDTDVNVLGTGALGFHAGRIPIWRDLFRHPNMADVHLACHTHMFGIPMVALAHEAGWLQDICPEAGRHIYQSNRNKDGTRCDATLNRKRELGRIDWWLQPRRPRIRVSIATCHRPDLLLFLLSDLVSEADRLDIEVAVYEDPTDSDYANTERFATRNGWQWHTFSRRLGRAKHWALVDRELRDCRNSEADWFVFLPDDIRLTRNALARAIDTWQRLDDPATLTLWRLENHEGQMNWTGLRPVERDEAFEIFHVDGIYLCRRETLEFFDYRLERVKALNQRTSSGVGRGMSIPLHRAGKRMYRVKRSLAIPVPDVPSVMNPDARDRQFDSWIYR